MPKSSQTGYNVLPYLKNIHVLLSVYDASNFVGIKRVHDRSTFRSPKVLGKMDPPDRLACLVNILFSDEEKYANIKDHVLPLFITKIFRNKPIT